MCKFDIAYAICKEGFKFTKMSELEERHGVDLGSEYKNNHLFTTLVWCACFEIKFFSIQADGTTDAGRIEDELFVVLFLDPHSEDVTLHVRSWLDVPSTALLMVGTGALKGVFPF